MKLKPFRSQLIQQLTDFDAVSGQVDADSLLCHCLAISRAQLLCIDFELSTQQQQLVQQLAKRYIDDEEPLDYLCGYSYFMGLKFKVNPHVLIPRADTENLVSWLIDYLNSKSTPSTSTVLDLGTGSAAIAISLIKYAKNLWITATDQSSLALDVAKDNAYNLLNKEQRACLQFLEGDWFKALKKKQFYDVIVSNPPYVDLEQQGLSKSLAHEPRRALYSAKQGLADLEIIIQQALGYLKPTGLLIVEHGFEQSEAVSLLLESNRFINITQHDDLAQRQRFTSAYCL